MVPDPDKTHRSFPQLKYPIYRDQEPKSGEQWLEGKRIQDGAEGLWRIHDGLYDLTHFIEKHPGGQQWIRDTKGTDITEAFEIHHINEVAEKILPKYFVRNATAPRNSPFTFKEDGFYKTLKPKIAKELKELPKSLRLKSDVTTVCLLLTLALLSPLACYTCSKSYLLGAGLIVLNSFVLSSVVISAHNYFHRRDNWQMYLFNLGGFSYSNWRISHAMSHHMYTNTLQDIELSKLEPFLYYTPNQEKMLCTQFAPLYWPVVFLFTSLGEMMRHLTTDLKEMRCKRVLSEYSIPLCLPIWMYVFGGLPLFQTLSIWLCTLMTSSAYFTVYGLTAGHHSHKNFFDGDIPRDTTLDWGLHQLDVIVERIDYAENHFKALTRFGDHALHHLFPTVDHAELKYLYPTFFKHCEKFHTELRTTTFYQALASQMKQLSRDDPIDFRKRTCNNN